MKRKYIPIPVPVGSPEPPAPVINRMTENEWSALTYVEQVAAGLTLVGDERDYTGEWYDLTNSLINLETPILAHFSTGTTGIDETFTATVSGNYLVFNYESVGEAQNEKKTSADITTTGIEVFSVSENSEYSSAGSRDMSSTFSLVTLSAGDTVTLSNEHVNNWSTQIHLIFVVVDEFDCNNVLAASRSISPFTETFTALEDVNIIAFVIDDTPASGVASSSITTVGGIHGDFAGGIERCQIDVANVGLETDETITLTTGDYTNYGTKTFLIYEIIPA